MFEDSTCSAPAGSAPRSAAMMAARTTLFHAPDAAPDPPPEPPPGYQLLDEIGRGGMGVVYRARDLALGRTVAVKFLRSWPPSGDAAVRRFLQEARITSQLQHPGIPPVHQVGTLPGGRPFLVMKLVTGQTLQTLLRLSEPADRGRLVAVFERVCQAVGYAHDSGVVHRDLKPSNVMVGRFGEVQVLDWGLAKALADPDPADAAGVAPEEAEAPARPDPNAVTGTGSVLGTPAFMSPEQARGERRRIDARSDVFGLGAVLCVILTGEPPYVADDAGALCLMAIRGQLSGAAARLSECGGDPVLVALCRRCLSPEPEDRPRDANEVAEAVAALRAAAEERARAAEVDRVRLDARHREQRQRRRVRAAVAGAAAVLLAAGAAFAWWADRQDGERQAAWARQQADLREAGLRSQLADERLAAERRERLGRTAGTVAALLGECEAALRADDGAAAALALDQAERRAAEGGADHLADRLARCRADRALLLELDRIDDRHWAVADGRTQGGPPAAGQLPAAFARYGLVPGATPRDEAVGRIRDSLVRDHVLTALDRWLGWSPSPDVLALLRAADPDDFRDAVRAAVADGAPARVAELAARPEALAQPARFAVVLGDAAAIPPARRRQLLLAALDPRPGDYRVLVTLGHLAMVESPGTPDGYEKWFRAAVAVRPRSPVAHNYLGLALLNKKDLAGAAAAFRASVHLDPRYAGAHNNLGVALQGRGEAAEALAAFRTAVRCYPDHPLAHGNLGTLSEANGDWDGAARAYAEWVRVAPDNPLALNRLAWVLATAPDARLRDGSKAVVVATRACERSGWAVASYIDTLAAALAEAGEFEKAVAAQRRALAFPQFGGITSARRRLALYEQGRAYHAAAPPPVAPPPREK